MVSVSNKLHIKSVVQGPSQANQTCPSKERPCPSLSFLRALRDALPSTKPSSNSSRFRLAPHLLFLPALRHYPPHKRHACRRGPRSDPSVRDKGHIFQPQALNRPHATRYPKCGVRMEGAAGCWQEGFLDYPV